VRTGFWAGKPEGNRLFGRRRLRREDNIKIDLQEVGWGTMDWIDLAGDRGKWRTVVNEVMNLLHHHHHHYHHHHHHRVLLLLMEHGASMKSFQALRSPAIPLTLFHDLPVFLISSSIVLCHVLFGLPLLLYP
jgi:hypothetical protein